MQRISVLGSVTSPSAPIRVLGDTILALRIRGDVTCLLLSRGARDAESELVSSRRWVSGVRGPRNRAACGHAVGRLELCHSRAVLLFVVVVCLQTSTGKVFGVTAAFDSDVEVTLYKHGGLLNFVARKFS